MPDDPIIWGHDRESGSIGIASWQRLSDERTARQAAELRRLRAIDDEATHLYWVLRSGGDSRAVLHLTSQEPPRRVWQVVPLCGSVYEGVNFATRHPANHYGARPAAVRHRRVCGVCGRRRKGRPASPDGETDEAMATRVALIGIGWLREKSRDPLDGIAERIRPLDADLAADIQRLNDDYLAAVRILQARAGKLRDELEAADA